MNAPESIEMKPAAGGGTQYTAHTPERGHHLMDDAEQAARQQRSRRATFVKWLRKVHGWIGLWGAALGLLFGTTGFLLNHRGGPLKCRPASRKWRCCRCRCRNPRRSRRVSWASGSSTN